MSERPTAASTPDFTTVPIARGVMYLAVPVFASQFLETSYNIVNGIWVGRVGTDSLAAINASAFFVWLIYSQLGVVSTGTSALVAHCVGAGRRQDAARVAAQGVLLSVGVGTLLSLLGLLLHRAVLRAMGLDATVCALASSYLFIIMSIIPIMAFTEVHAAILRGYGDTRTPTRIWAAVLLLNTILVSCLVSGRGPWPRLGIVGAGWSTAIAMLFGLAVYVWLLAGRRLPFTLAGPATAGHDFVRDILRIGFPTSFSSVVFCLVYMGLTRILSEFGTSAVAAVGIGHRVESLSYMTCIAFSLAAITMVGQNKGASLIERAERSAWSATGLASIACFVYCVVMVSWPHQLAAVFSRDPAVIEVAAGYVRIVGLAQLFMAVDVVLEGAFSGAGDTVPPMLLSIPLTLARLPCAWWFGVHRGGGVFAVWWVIAALMVGRGALMAAVFAAGRWKSKQVLREPSPAFTEEEVAFEGALHTPVRD